MLLFLISFASDKGGVGLDTTTGGGSEESVEFCLENAELLNDIAEGEGDGEGAGSKDTGDTL